MCQKRLSRDVEFMYSDQSLIWVVKYTVLLVTWKALCHMIYTLVKKESRDCFNLITHLITMNIDYYFNDAKDIKIALK